MAAEVPSDVEAVLTQLFEEGRAAVRAGELDTVRRLLSSAQTVVRNKLPPGELRAQLLHGCRRASAAVDAVEPEVAAAYFTAMERRLCEDG